MTQYVFAPFVTIYSRCPICGALTVEEAFRGAVVCPEHGAVPNELVEDGFTGVDALIELRAWEARQEIRQMAAYAMCKIGADLDMFLWRQRAETLRRRFVDAINRRMT